MEHRRKISTELKQLRHRISALEAQIEPTPSKVQKPLTSRIALILLVLSLTLIITSTAVSQSVDCTDPAIGLLCVFSPNTPAKANVVNSNFTNLKQWLEAKVGVVNEPANLQNPTVTGTLQAETIAVSQILEAQCPPGTQPLGAWCITTENRGPASWAQAVSDCAAQGLSICSLEALITCDQLEPDDYECTADTDADMWLATTRIAFNEEIPFHQNIVILNGSANALDTTTNSDTSLFYYCCSQGPAVGLP